MNWSLVFDAFWFFMLKLEVKSYFKTLNYSVEKNLVELTKRLEVDTKTNNIYFRGFYSNMADEDVKNGVCGDLSLILYNLIKDRYSSKFKIKNSYGTEPDFFYVDEKFTFGHVFLTIERKDGRVYVVDPTFKVFNLLQNTGYKIDNEVNPINLSMYPDNRFMITSHYSFTPLKFVRDYVLLLAFFYKDNKNYSFKIVSKKKGQRYINNLFSIIMSNGERLLIDKFSSPKHGDLKQPIKPLDIEHIRKKLITLFDGIVIK